jgi:DNA-binding MarR family transcriptional regulator
MVHVSDPQFLVLHGLKLKGFAEAPGLVELMGLDIATVEVHLEAVAAQDLVAHRDGRISGWSLTAAGRARHAQLLAEDREAAGCSAALAAGYPRFCELNAELKALCTDWQLRDGVINDHSDATYDAAIIIRLRALNDAVQPLCDQAAAALNRLSPYGPRLTRAVERLEAGDIDRFTKPLANSYHDIWMEWHEDLIATMALTRTAADA